MLYGIQENVDDKNEKVKKDIINVIKYLAPNTDTDDMKYFRLALKRLCMRSSKHAKSLKSNQSYHRLSVSLDRTTKHIQFYRSLKEELNNRLSAGESNLKLKYIRTKINLIHSLICDAEYDFNYLDETALSQDFSFRLV
ncbi:hypothetical protein FQA39_LY13340 [Lamprigera yunnana]|nr:hypothetical protein FQA39_LY13340 [Lamprigera yunnana]